MKWLGLILVIGGAYVMHSQAKVTDVTRVYSG
jgi:hypothetical protein